MLGGAGLELPYPWIMRNGITIRGQWMFDRDAVTEFALDDANEGVAHAAANAGPLRMTVIRP